MTPPSSRSYNPSFSRDRVVVADKDKDKVGVFDPKETAEAAVAEVSAMVVPLIIGPGGKPASSPEKDLELTLGILNGNFVTRIEPFRI